MLLDQLRKQLGKVFSNTEGEKAVARKTQIPMEEVYTQ